jgi:hypothetical protein
VVQSLELKTNKHENLVLVHVKVNKLWYFHVTQIYTFYVQWIQCLWMEHFNSEQNFSTKCLQFMVL